MRTGIYLKQLAQSSLCKPTFLIRDMHCYTLCLLTIRNNSLVQNFLIMAANILPITMFFLKDGRPLIQMLTEPLPSTRRSRQNCPESGYFVHFDTASMMSKGDGMSTFSRVSSLRRRSSGTPFYIQTPASQPGAGRKQHVEIDSQQSHIELDGFEHVELDTGSGTTRTVICKVMPGETLLLSPQGRDR